MFFRKTCLAEKRRRYKRHPQVMRKLQMPSFYISLYKIMLEVKNLSISFGGLRAVDEFSISIRKGQLYGLIGPNGAGKTTVFNLLTGVPSIPASHSDSSRPPVHPKAEASDLSQAPLQSQAFSAFHTGDSAPDTPLPRK